MPDNQHQTIIECLEIFNDTVKKLNNYNFIKNKKTTLIIHLDGSKRASYKGPTEEELSAFILHYRKTFQDKDDISLKNLEKIYEKFPDKDFYKRFVGIKKEIDSILNKSTNVTTNGHNWTNREIHDSFIKGNLAHIQSKYDKRKKYLEIKKDNIKHTIFERDLTLFLQRIFKQFIEIKILNAEVLEEIKKYNME